MKKILTIATREYRAMVGTKAFLLSIIMMPVLMLGGIFAMDLMKRVGEIKERKLAIVDHSGFLFAELEAAAERHNQSVDRSRESSEEQESNQPDMPGATAEKYELIAVDAASFDDDQRIKLSDQVRQQELYAFVEIPDEIEKTGLTDDNQVQFYSQDSSLSLARRWLGNELTRVVRKRRVGELTRGRSGCELVQGHLGTSPSTWRRCITRGSSPWSCTA